MIMRIAVFAGLVTVAFATAPAHAEALRQAAAPLVPMTRADGEVCDLLRAEAGDHCKQLVRDGAATVYQSGTRRAGIHRIVLAIDTGRDVLVSPPIDLVAEQLQATQPTLRAVEIDGRPGVVLDVVSIWKRGTATQRTGSQIRCSQDAAIWKCAQLEVGAFEAGTSAAGSAVASGSATPSLTPSAVPPLPSLSSLFRL